MATATETPSKPATAPQRSLAQRLTALDRANLVRKKRAQLKRDLKASPELIAAVLHRPAWYAENAQIFDLLLALPRYGRVKVRKLLKTCGIAESKTVGGLSQRQRDALVAHLAR